jgi:hypothetical protein
MLSKRPSFDSRHYHGPIIGAQSAATRWQPVHENEPRMALALRFLMGVQVMLKREELTFPERVD